MEAQSTTEAGIIVMSSCANQVIYLCRILGELGGRVFSSTRTFCDIGDLLLAEQGSYNIRSKHLVIRFVGLYN